MKFMLQGKDGNPMNMTIVNKILDEIGHHRFADIPLIQEGVIMPTIEFAEEEYDQIVNQIKKVLGLPDQLEIILKGPHWDKLPDKCTICYKGEF